MRVCSTKYFQTCAVMKYDLCSVLTYLFLGTIILTAINGQHGEFWKNRIEYEGCEANSDPCILTCKVKFLNSSNASIIWKNEDIVINSSVTYHFLPRVHIFSNLTLNSNVTGNFSCHVYINDSSEPFLSHTFHISGDQTSPNIINSGYNISGTGNCNVTFTCTIQSNPKLDVLWMKRDTDKIKLHVIENQYNWTDYITDEEYDAGLVITDYNFDYDGGTYYCFAVNDIDVTISPPMSPYIAPGKPDVNPARITFKPGDDISASCSSTGGFPAPYITWEFMAGSHANTTNYTAVDKGQSVNSISAVSQWADDKSILRCNVKDRVKGDVNYNDIKLRITDEPFMVSYNTCSPSNFTTNNDSCVLACEAYSKWYCVSQWIYTFAPEYVSNPDYPLGDSSYEKDGLCSITIALSDYWAGRYTCVLTTRGRNLTNTFQIEDSSIGTYIGGTCRNEHQCGALNSECIQHKCQCPDNFPVPWESNAYTAACLSASHPNENCQIDRQCSYTAENYVCYHSVPYSDYGSCECIDPYFVAFVTETDQWQCILKASYMENCEYDAQCLWSDPYLECTSYGYCDCKDGYYYSTTYNWCQYNTMAHYLSLTATVGIVIGITALLIIIFVLAILYIRSSTIRTRRRFQQADAIRQQANNNSASNLTGHENNSGGPHYPVDLPPSYFEAQRSETPPPPFDSIMDNKLFSEEDEQQINTTLTPEYDNRSTSSITLTLDSTESCSHSNPAFDDAEC